MRSRSYLGDGVYASVDIYGDIELELQPGSEIKARIVLDKDVWHALLDWYQHHGPNQGKTCAVVEVPNCVFGQVVEDLRQLNEIATPPRTKVQ